MSYRAFLEAFQIDNGDTGASGIGDGDGSDATSAEGHETQRLATPGVTDSSAHASASILHIDHDAHQTLQTRGQEIGGEPVNSNVVSRSATPSTTASAKVRRLTACACRLYDSLACSNATHSHTTHHIVTDILPSLSVTH